MARTPDTLREDFGECGLENEIRDPETFHESARRHARGLDSDEARQRVLMELYEKVFATALKKNAARLGIVHTPVGVVDFIPNRADRAFRAEAHRQSLVVARGAQAQEDQEFVDAISDWCQE